MCINYPNLAEAVSEIESLHQELEETKKQSRSFWDIQGYDISFISQPE